MSTNEAATPWNDELPAPPDEGGPSGKGDVTPVSGVISGSLFGDVPKFGDTIPKGTWAFRLDGVMDMWPDQRGDDPEEALFGKQPSFMLRWVCQQEPHTGLQFMDWVDWVNEETIKEAIGGHPVAKSILKKRLMRIKAIMEECGFKPKSNFDIKQDFFNTHPEVNIQVGIREKKQRGPEGKPVGTGQMVNFAVQYMSLHRPA